MRDIDTTHLVLATTLLCILAGLVRAPDMVRAVWAWRKRTRRHRTDYHYEVTAWPTTRADEEPRPLNARARAQINEILAKCEVEEW